MANTTGKKFGGKGYKNLKRQKLRSNKGIVSNEDDVQALLQELSGTE
jgi:hypothetical protein